MTTKWAYQAEMIAACNCDWGCPCNFNQKPTNGNCDGVWTAHITSGSCGDTKLDGLKCAFGGRWPGALHEGRGSAQLWIDETASAEQREALEGILKGRFQGLPWMIIAATVDNWSDTTYVPFEWTFDAQRSSVNAGNQVRISLDDMRNPVSGLETSATIMLPTGLITNELHATATRQMAVFGPGIKMAAPGKYGFYCAANHAN